MGYLSAFMLLQLLGLLVFVAVVDSLQLLTVRMNFLHGLAAFIVCNEKA